MCSAPDPNAGIRQQAKIDKMKKDTQYHSASLKYWNREAAANQRRGTLGRGLSRSKSDAYSKALWTLGKGREANEQIYRARSKLARHSDRSGESRARGYMGAKYKQILDQQRKIESSLNATFGRNMDTVYQGIQRFHMNKVAKNRESIGIRPEYGAPVMMPPRDRTGQMMGNLQMGLQIASLGFAAFSDIKLKENIEKVGVSPNGHNIYEWNYVYDQENRFRGVIAQDVMKINPMAVGIRKNYLTVDYSKVDVDMEIIT